MGHRHGRANRTTRGGGLGPATALLAAAMIGLLSWLLRKTERDYEERGRLSAEASAAGWSLYITHAALTLVASWRSPRSQGKRPRMARGGATALFGSWFFVAAVREFRSFEQMSGVETGNLVTSGPYRYSRNPQVVGWGLALLGAALAGRSSRALLLVAAFFLAHRIYFVIEERHLERAFGEEYRRYRATTPRWLGPPGGE